MKQFCLLLLCCLSATAILGAQQLTGGIAGTVTDRSGAVIVGAKVKAVHAATNLALTAETAKDGSYQIANIPAGPYTVNFSMAGFKTESHTSILVEGNRTTTVVGRLEIGTLNTTA